MTPQQKLDSLTAFDEYGFVKGIDTDWETHRPLLYLGLAESIGPVTELGSGEGSTPYLTKYCAAHNRPFWSFESNLDWAAKMGSLYVKDWSMIKSLWMKPCGLLFIDHAPGEHRKVALAAMVDRADVIVVHDTEIGGLGDYGLEPLWSKFAHVLHYNRSGGGAGATIVSNKVWLSEYKGCTFGGRTLQ